MKYQRLVCNTTPSSLQDWLDEKLDSLGIDGVYTRYILSLLQQDSMDVDPFENHYLSFKSHQQKICQKYFEPEILHCGIKNKQNQKWKTKMGKNILLNPYSILYNATIMDVEKMRKKAATECLKSLTDEVEDIDNLVDEICLRLKNIINTEIETGDNSGFNSKQIKRKTCFNFPPSSPTDEAEKYFAAFPPLNSGTEQSTDRKYLKSVENIWCNKCKKKITKPEDLNFEQDNFDSCELKENRNSFKTLIPYDSLKVMGNVRKSDVLERSEPCKKGSFGLQSALSDLLSVQTISSSHLSPTCNKQQISLVMKKKINFGKYLKDRAPKKSSIIMSPNLLFNSLVNLKINVGAFNTLNKNYIIKYLNMNKIKVALDTSENECSEYLTDDDEDSCIVQLSNKFKNLSSIWYNCSSKSNTHELSLQSGNSDINSVWSYEEGNLSLFPVLRGISGASIQRSDNISVDHNSGFMSHNFESNIGAAKESQTAVSHLSNSNVPFNFDYLLFDQKRNIQNECTCLAASNIRCFSGNCNSCFVNNSIENSNMKKFNSARTRFDSSTFESNRCESPNGHYSCQNEFNEESLVFNDFELQYKPYETEQALFEGSLTDTSISFQNKAVQRGNQQNNSVSINLDTSEKFDDVTGMQLTFGDNTDITSFDHSTTADEKQTAFDSSKYWNNISSNKSMHNEMSFNDWMGSFGVNESIWALDLSDVNENGNKDLSLLAGSSEEVIALRREIKEEEDDLLRGLCGPKDLADAMIPNDFEPELSANIDRSNIVGEMNNYTSNLKYFTCNISASECEQSEAQEFTCDVPTNFNTESISEEEFYAVGACNDYYPEGIHYYQGSSNDIQCIQYSTNFFNSADSEDPCYKDLNRVQEYTDEDFNDWSYEIGDEFEDANTVNYSSPLHYNLDQPVNEQTGFGDSLDSFLDSEILNDELTPKTFYYKGIRRRVKSKILAGRKPCTFYIGGKCQREDCKFTHDLSTVTCRFWMEGSCFKGDTCPFLHGVFRSCQNQNSQTFKHKDYSRRFRSKSPDCKYTLESEADFPSLSIGSATCTTTKSQPVCIASEKGCKTPVAILPEKGNKTPVAVPPEKGSKSKRKKTKSQSSNNSDENTEPFKRGEKKPGI